ncbi:MAG: hypothetical protein FHP92_12905 [Denitromonas halophila]|nr:MAG: hypothetical protein FHP92_12905 [Denitromonas halophila]
MQDQTQTQISQGPVQYSEAPHADIFAYLPFWLPQTHEAAAWLEELDFLDPHTGDLEELANLASRAPSRGAQQWVLGVVGRRLRIQARRAAAEQ